MKTYLFTTFLALPITVSIMPLVMAFARRFNLIDKPNARKVHKQTVPRVGGIAFVLAMLISFIVAILLVPWLKAAFVSMQAQTLVLLASSAFIFLVGLTDDKWQLTGKAKFLALMLASFAVCASGSSIRSLNVGTLFVFDLGHFSWFVTALWITGITVGINFMDGLDGLAGGLSAIAAVAIAILAIYVGLPLVAVIMFALLGSLLGFLRFNRNPAKIFMGDCGSMFLGFILGASSVTCVSTSGSIETLGITAVVLGIPIIDAGCTMIRRHILERRSIFNAERGHIHHRLLDLGLTQKQVIFILHTVTILASTMAMFTLITHGIETVVVLLCILVLYLVFFRAVGSYSLRKTIGAIKRNRAIKRYKKNFHSNFEEMQLHFNRVKAFDEWWQAVSATADKMHFLSLNMPITNHDGTKHVLEWKNQVSDNTKRQKRITLSIPISDYRLGKETELKVEVCKEASLELTAHKITLFGRLLDEYSPLPEPTSKN